MFPNKVKKNNESLVKYKTEVINKLGVEVYYEDDEQIAYFLKKIYQNT
jgi:hypothetical protein